MKKILPRYLSGTNPYGDWYDPNYTWEQNWMRNRLPQIRDNAKNFLKAIPGLSKEQRWDMQREAESRIFPLVPENNLEPGYKSTEPLVDEMRRLNKYYNFNDSELDLHGMYNGIMRSRKNMMLDPRSIYGIEDIQKWRKAGTLDHRLLDVPDDLLVEYFNELASNKNPLFNPNNMRYSFGGPIKQTSRMMMFV